MFATRREVQAVVLIAERRSTIAYPQSAPLSISMIAGVECDESAIDTGL
jgi:hypothetical protein